MDPVAAVLAGPYPRCMPLCQRCGAEITRTSNRQIFCSIACRNGLRSCVVCNTEFAARPDTSGRFCSLTCFQRERTRLADERRAQERPCVACGRPTPPEGFYQGRQACRACVVERVGANPNRLANERRYHETNKVRLNAARVERQRLEDGSRQARYKRNHPEKHADTQSRRRARKLGNGVERYDRLDIFARDGGVCQLCFDPIDPLLVYPDPMSFSIDHVTPIVLGGPDTPANVQASHLRCNIRKGGG